MLALFLLLGLLAVDERGLTGDLEIKRMEAGEDVRHEVIIGEGRRIPLKEEIPLPTHLDFEAYNIMEDADSGTVSFIFPHLGKWYAVFSNEDQVVNSVVLNFNARLYENTGGWTVVDSCSFLGIIPPGEKSYIVWDGVNLEVVSPDYGLTSTAQTAVDNIYDWLKLPLLDNFSQMSLSCQDVYAQLILDTPWPYKDELAFVIAHTDPGILAHHRASPEIFVDNVHTIYSHDTLLGYVELVEHPDFTTAKYWIVDTLGDTIEVEIPKERYYWDIVHPILSDEAPLYINPRTGREASPPTGKFWRDYLFNYSDTATVRRISHCRTDTIPVGFVSPILREELQGINVLWCNRVNDFEDNGAIGVVTRWARDVLVFNSGHERPIQPVRIYHMHWGRCGEWADLTGAAGRSALIPTNMPLSMPNDHIWNEFYDGEWRHWEPVNSMIDSPHSYDSNWWDMVLPFNFRGDGWIWDVTPRYTPYCTLSVFVGDATGAPVDGARVLVASQDEAGAGIFVAGWHFTGSDGFARFLLGDLTNYFVRIDAGDIGSFPIDPNRVVAVISNSIPGQHYTWHRNLSGTMPTIPVTEATLVDTTIYKIEIDFSVVNEIIYGQTLFRNVLDIRQEFAKWVDEGNIEFFISDSVNFHLYGVEETYASSNLRLFVYPTIGKNATIKFTLPEEMNTNISLYDISGRLIKEIVNRVFREGEHQVLLNERSLSTGIYFIRLTTEKKALTRKIVWL